MDKNNINDIMAKLKDMVRKGNVSRIVVGKDGKELVNIPVNVGIVGGVVGLAAAKWVVIAAVLATVGFGCTVQVIKEDGEITEVFGKEQADKARSKATEIVEDVKEKFSFDEIVKTLKWSAAPGDIILTVGAGDIYKVGERLLSE